MPKTTFYTLSAEEFLNLNKLLTDAELRTYLYLITNNPFHDSQMKIDTALISEQLGLTIRSVQRAIKHLKEIHLIEVEVIKSKYTQAVHGISSRIKNGDPNVVSKDLNDLNVVTDDPNVVANDPNVVTDDPNVVANDPNVVANDPNVVANDPNVVNTSLKLLSDKLSDSSHTIHTYSDFKKTLSDSERENFESFVRNEWRNQKSEEILSIERFLSKPEDFKNWYNAFLKSSAGSATKQKALTLENDWANHPRRDEWLEEIRQGRPRFIALGGPRQERLMRVSFVDWAEANNLVWGVES